jgi:hypothetical protein
MSIVRGFFSVECCPGFMICIIKIMAESGARMLVGGEEYVI